MTEPTLQLFSLTLNYNIYISATWFSAVSIQGK